MAQSSKDQDQKETIASDSLIVPCQTRYIVLKSYSVDNVIKAMENGVWSSKTKNGVLDAIWKESGSSCPIMLFFSITGSKQYCATAQMASGLEDSTKFVFGKNFKKEFQLRWLLIKDVPNYVIKKETKHNVRAKDGQELSAEEGDALWRCMNNYEHTTSLLRPKPLLAQEQIYNPPMVPRQFY